MLIVFLVDVLICICCSRTDWSWMSKSATALVSQWSNS